MAKNEQKIKFEADVTGFKNNIKEAQKSIKTLNNELKLNREQLKGDEKDTTALSDRIETLNKKYEEQTKVVENTRLSYEKAVEVFGENSTEAENLKNKLLQEETALQRVRNEINETNKKLDAQTNWLKNTGKEWEESGKRLQEYGKKIETVGNKLSILSGAVGGIAVASLKSSVDFESAFTGVTKTVDGTEEQLAQLREEILELSTQLPSSASEIASVAESAGQLGIATEDIMSFTKIMIDLGNSTNVSADEASTSLAKFANVTKMSAKDYEKLGSTIVDLGNNFATTEADIIAMGQNLASAGTQVGMSQSDIMALATALSSVGLEAQAGGTAFSKALVSMQLAVETNSKDLKNWADVAGMSTKEFSKLFKEDATSALEAFIKGLSEFGGESESAIKVLDDMGITETRLRDSLLRSANASDTFSSAIKVGSKAWEENTALTNEANKRYSTTESQMKMLKNEVQKTAIEFGDELAPSFRQIVKDAKPLLNNIASAVKSFSKLDAQTKQSILRMGALVVAGGPVIKMGGKLITTLGSAKTAVGTFSGAIGVLKKGEEGASDGAIKMAKSLSSTPAMIVGATTATLALSVALGKLNEKYYENRNELGNNIDKLRETTNAQITSRNELIQAQQASIDSGFGEIAIIDKLVPELDKIVDENGKVKDGYENRANYILTELNKALGTEYQLNGNIIEQYSQLRDEIDKLILKKKAQIILNAKEALYTEAIENQQKALENVLQAQENYERAKEEASKDHGSRQKNLEAITNESKAYQELNDAKLISAKYSQDILEYETNVARIASDNTEELQKVVNSATVNFVENGKIVDDSFQRVVTAQKLGLEQARANFSKQAQNADETQKQILQSQVDSAKKQLETTIKTLADQTSVVENDQSVVDAWKYLYRNQRSLFDEYVEGLPEDLKNTIQKMVGIVESSPETDGLLNSSASLGENVAGNMDASSQAEESARSLLMSYDESLKKHSEVIGQTSVGIGMKTAQELDKSEVSKNSAINTLQSYLNGLNDQELKELLKYAGVSDVDMVMKGIREGNLAQSEGQKILTSLTKGLQDGTLTSGLYNTAKGLANKLTGLLNIKAVISSTAIPGHKSGLDYVPYDNYIARLHKGERVLTAEENREYLAGNIENKVANRNLVVQFYPRTMDESELKRAENYIARKWGMSL